jgi:endonuclease YncB( thermonuclease family)
MIAVPFLSNRTAVSKSPSVSYKVAPQQVVTKMAVKSWQPPEDRTRLQCGVPVLDCGHCGLSGGRLAWLGCTVKLQCPENGTRAVSFAEAIDGATFRASDGSEIRLSGVIAQGAEGETPSPRNAERAREALAAHLKSGPLTLAASTTDRYGRTLAHVFADGMWVQALMLRQGEARVSPDLLGDGCAKALLRAEDEGRRANAGHWSDHAFAVLSADQLKGRIGPFQLVEGTVVTATITTDYRSDFTVTVSPADMRAFRQAKFDVRLLANASACAAGWNSTTDRK